MQNRIPMHSGAWKLLVEAMNSILIEVAKPMAEVWKVMAGDIERKSSVRLRGDYQGESAFWPNRPIRTASMLNESWRGH